MPTNTQTSKPTAASPDVLLKEAAAYVNAAGPKLEQLAGVDATMKRASEQLPAKLLAHGLLSRIDAEKLASDLRGPSGVDKLAEVVDFALTHAVSTKRELGQVASKQAALGGTSQPRQRTSDEIWRSGFSPNSRN